MKELFNTYYPEKIQQHDLMIVRIVYPQDNPVWIKPNVSAVNSYLAERFTWTLLRIKDAYLARLNDHFDTGIISMTNFVSDVMWSKPATRDDSGPTDWRGPGVPVANPDTVWILPAATLVCEIERGNGAFAMAHSFIVNFFSDLPHHTSYQGRPRYWFEQLSKLGYRGEETTMARLNYFADRAKELHYVDNAVISPAAVGHWFDAEYQDKVKNES